MPRPYSLDLREKVLNFISTGRSKREAAKIFGIGEDSVYRWIRLEKHGNLKPKKPVFLPRKIDLNVLRSHLENNPDHTLKEIAIALGLGVQTIWKWLRFLKITRKKRRYVTQRGMLTNVQNSKLKYH